MTKRKRVLLTVVVLLVLLPVFVWFGGRWVLSWSLATYSGEIAVDGLHAPVGIDFDGRAVPQVWAGDAHDLFFAQGWLHASERLFQMELVRRLARGELAELLGSGFVGADTEQRHLGFLRRARTDLDGLDADTRQMLDAYCAGINAWIRSRSVLPPELVLLRHSPRDWTPEDCLAILGYQTWFSVSLMDGNGRYRRLIDRLGDDVRTLMRDVDWSPAAVPDSALEARLPTGIAGASNSWVVGPRLTRSGAALHASDPHLGLDTAPGSWYVVGLHAPDLDFVGVTVPGLPLGLMGHNGHIAFAFTVAVVDLIDYYELRLDPENPDHVVTGNGREQIRVIEERIDVKDEPEPRVVTIESTSRGVVIERDEERVITMRWAGADFAAGDALRSGRQLLEATDFSAFQKAVTGFGALAANWTYSDRQGNIAYQLGTAIPRRTYADTFSTLDGANPELVWRGYYPVEQTPFVLNPESGWVATCNNRVVSENWPYPVPGFWDPYRITRVEQWLANASSVGPEDMTAMQLDLVSARALRWRQEFAAGAQLRGDDDLARQIRAWDGVMAAEHRLPALFAAWWHFLAEEVFRDDLGDQWWLGRGLTTEVLTFRPRELLDDTTTPQDEGLDEISARAFDRALDLVGERTWGDMSRLDISHPLSRVAILDRWLGLDRGPYAAVGGDSGSLNATWYRVDVDTPAFRTTVGPSMRFVLDWSDPDAFSIVTHMGQSGNPLSPHYDSFIEDWLRGRTWNVPFSKEAVAARRSSSLILEPTQ